MKTSFLLLFVATTCLAQSAPARPKITGIDHVDYYTTDPAANKHLYADILGLASADPVEANQTQRFLVGAQWVGYSPAPDASATNRLDHVAFTTDDCAGLRKYLAGNGIKVPDSLGRLKDGRRILTIQDPEGHSIEFVEGAKAKKSEGSDPVSRRMIHTGFIVRDRAAEDHFYKDILGFRLYWHGGMKDGETDWVAMQVPDGDNWLEYMLNVEPTPDRREAGVMNHISLGVHDMKQAQAKLEGHGWKPHGPEHAQMGRDGKWQLNVYDPDLTRVELMEFKPVEKPCCSDFTGPHPKEQ